MTTLLMHYDNSHEQFGWLLKDVPGTDKLPERLMHDSTQEEINEFNKLFRKETKLHQLDYSKTPSPRSMRSRMTKSPSVFSNTWPSPRLSHKIEMDDNEGIEEPRYQFFKVATFLDNRLEDMSYQTSKLQKQTKSLKQAYEELDDTTSQLLIDVRHLIAEMKCVRNLEDLIRLLDGKTESISSQKWPFVMAHSSPFRELNLII